MKAIARRELARLAGVAQSTVTKAAAPGGPIADAVLTHGRGLDLDHPSVQSWLRKRDVDPTSPAVRGEPVQPTTTQKATRSPESDPAGFGHLTLEQVAKMPIVELLQRFGHIDDLKGWLDAAKKAADTYAVDLKNLEARGKVIDRDMVRTHVFGAMEGSHVKLLGDTPKSITRRVYEMAGAGEDIEKAERVVRELISSQLKPAMQAAKKAVRA